jgi:hypothetical protein
MLPVVCGFKMNPGVYIITQKQRRGEGIVQGRKMKRKGKKRTGKKGHTLFVLFIYLFYSYVHTFGSFLSPLLPSPLLPLFFFFFKARNAS